MSRESIIAYYGGLRATFDYSKEKKRLGKTIHLLGKLEVVDRLTALNDKRVYSDSSWLSYEATALQRFSEVVSDLRNVDFVREYSHVIEGLVLVIRNRQDEGKFVQAEKWNNLFNHYEITRMGLKHAKDATEQAKRAW